MPRKPFEDQPYDPISADLARDVGGNGRLHVALAAPRVSATTAADSSSMKPGMNCWPTQTPPPRRLPPTVAMGTPTPRNEPVRDSKPTASLSPVGSRELVITKRFVMNRTEDADLSGFLLRLEQRCGAKVTVSVFVRALVAVAMQAEEMILEEAGQFQFRRPSTHNSLALSEFEDQWRECFAEALRRGRNTSLPR